jgi:DNA-directed RNA polymerase subunit RPC12/RpoP
MIRVVCQTCGAQFDTEERYAGQVAKCSNCGSQIVIPAAPAPAAYPGGAAGAVPPVAYPGTPGAAAPPAAAGRPGKVTAIGIMTLVGGIVAGLVSITWFIYGLFFGLATLGIGFLLFLPATYSLILAVIATVKGILLLTARPQQRSGPLVTAILQIVNIITCDGANVIMGILILVFLSDPNVKAYYRR